MSMITERDRKAGPPLAAAAPGTTGHDRARFVREARRARAAEFARLFHAVGRGLASLVRAPLAPSRPSRAGRPAPQQGRPALELPWGARPL